MALPSYQDRVIRSQVAEAMTLAEVAQKEVEDYYKAKKRLPENNARAGLPKPEKFKANFVTRLEVVDGAVTITLGNRINRNVAGKTLTIRPAIVKDAPIIPVAWVCGYATTPDGMTAAGKNDSNLSLRHVPVKCRY
ncbi:MAG: pilin [Deltaproteobacteria bacterium]|nr:pilin [Deltaproteobacteria bacterium]